MYVHLLQSKFAGIDFPVHPLVRRIEATRVANHADLAGFLLSDRDRLGILEAVGERYLDLNMLAGPQALYGLRGMHLCWRAQNDRIDRWIAERIVESRAMTVVAVFSGKRLGALWDPADEPP